MEHLVRILQVFVNDKVLVILSVTAITILCILKPPNSSEVVTAAFTGLFGIAVGMGMRRAGDVRNGNGQPPPPTPPTITFTEGGTK